MNFEEQLWVEISDGTDLSVSIKRVISLTGTTLSIIIGGYGEYHDAKFDISDPTSIENARAWFIVSYASITAAHDSLKASYERVLTMSIQALADEIATGIFRNLKDRHELKGYGCFVGDTFILTYSRQEETDPKASIDLEVDLNDPQFMDKIETEVAKLTGRIITESSTAHTHQ